MLVRRIIPVTGKCPPGAARRSDLECQVSELAVVCRGEIWVSISVGAQIPVAMRTNVCILAPGRDRRRWPLCGGRGGVADGEPYGAVAKVGDYVKARTPRPASGPSACSAGSKAGPSPRHPGHTRADKRAGPDHGGVAHEKGQPRRVALPAILTTNDASPPLRPHSPSRGTTRWHRTCRHGWSSGRGKHACLRCPDRRPRLPWFRQRSRVICWRWHGHEPRNRLG